ncbi:MAG: UDP-N-acetylmuramate--L-alanine ligase [Candidatus Gracilibacteria bacterium]
MTIYCIGIGGIGMSYVARLLKSEGHHVIGADAVEGSTTSELRAEGIEIVIGHKASNIPEDVSLILLSPAILSSQPEDYLEAKNRGVETKTWQEYIGEKTKQMKTIAVCGAHGKSTTTAMVGLMLIEAGYDPTVLVGTKLKEFNGSNIRFGKSEWLVIEADEFNDNFLNYYPTYTLLTSFEPDHLDYFKTPERYRASFVEFLSRTPVDGKVFYHNTQKETEILIHEQNISSAPVREEVGYMLQVPGKHNRENASLVDALGEEIGIPAEIREKSLKAFKGTWRRQEFKGETAGGALVYDDYGHHPTEVRVTLAGFREMFPEKKIICIFQPHQYSRVRTFLKDFSEAFSDADAVIIPNIYASRDSEEDKRSMTAQIVVDEISKHQNNVYFGDGLKESMELVKTNSEWNTSNSVIITMGAGDVTYISDWLVENNQYAVPE